MSAKKSWDVQRKPTAATPARAALPTRARVPARAAAPMKRSETLRHVERVPGTRARRTAPRGPSLKKKRADKRSALRLVVLILGLILLGAINYVLWLPSLRVQAIEGVGKDPSGIATAAKQAMMGTQFLIVPKDSILLVPEKAIRAKVMEAYPDVQAVSIQATGLTALRVSTITRVSTFVWCGESVDAPADQCYQADTEGLVFAPRGGGGVTDATTTATTTARLPDGKELLVYGPLEGDGDSPVRKHVTYASALPTALQFIKAMRGLGADIASVTLRNDEIDLHTRAGTRITYVIGREDDAATLAATAVPNLNLNDGSIQYIDLRFANKVYLKRTGAAPGETPAE